MINSNETPCHGKPMIRGLGCGKAALSGRQLDCHRNCNLICNGPAPALPFAFNEFQDSSGCRTRLQMGFCTSLGAWVVPEPLCRVLVASPGLPRPTPQRMGGSAGSRLADAPMPGAPGTRGARPARHQLPAAPTTCALRAAARRLHHGTSWPGPAPLHAASNVC